MRKAILIILILIQQTSYSQTKTYKVAGSDYIKLIYSTLYFFENYKDSLKEISYSIYDDSLMRMWDAKVIKTIDDYGQFPPLKVNELDTNFNLFNDLKNKVYLLNRSDAKDCYFLKDEKTLIRKTLHKSHIWHQVEYGEFKIYKVDLGNNRIIFWANGLGIIYKIKNELKTNFLPLEYFYKYNQYEIAGNRSEILIKDKDSVDMEVGYFDFGDYRVLQKQSNNKDDKYVATKNGQVILDDLSIKYYNAKSLMSYENGVLTFYNNNLKIDSQFYYRQIYEGWDDLEFLVNNQIKRVSIRGYISTFQKSFNGVCGTVAHYSIKLNKNNATFTSDRERIGGNTITENIPIISKFEYDSITFITHQNEMSWSENGGFNNQVVLYKDGYQGLYSFDLKDSLVVLKEMLPKKFNSIHLINGNLIVNKSGQEDFFTYYIQKKKMRFKRISYEKCSYLRYRKINDRKGWIDSKGILFDDKK